MGNNSKTGNGGSNGETRRKFLFITQYGLLLDLAWKISREGGAVKFFIADKEERDIGDGFVEKVDAWQPHKDWADVIVFDDIGYADQVEKLKKAGKLVIGGGAYADRLELDRNFAQQEMKEAGLNTVPWWNFESFDAAITYVDKNPGRYVVKPNGQAQDDKVLSFVGQEEDGRDIMTILEHYKRGWGKKIKSFQLQKYIPGVEVAVGAFFNGKNFIFPVCVNFEHKKLFNNEIGPSTGEMGTTSFWTEPNRLYAETLAKMESRLAREGFVGYFDINCIATARAVHPLEITPRFGYPTINLQIEGVTSHWGDFLYSLAKGEAYNLRTRRGFQVAVVAAVPPYPFVDEGMFQRYSKDGLVIFRRPLPEGSVHPCEVRIEEDEWKLAGSSGYTLVVTGSGTTMEDARKEAYNRVRNVIIPNFFYRTDIGELWATDGDKLQAWGYLASILPAPATPPPSSSNS